MSITLNAHTNLPNAVNLIGIAIRQGFEPLGDALLNSLKSRSPQDRGKFKKGLKKRISGKGLQTRMLIYNWADHAEWVEKGRTPGKQPPPQAMLGWVIRKGFSGTLQQKKSKAFLVGRKIGRDGIPGLWLFRTLKQVEAARILAAMTAIRANVIALMNA